MTGKRRKYDREFKMNALQFYEESGKRLRDVESALGLGSGCLRHWGRELEQEKENAFPGNGNLSPEAKEMARLKRENEILKQERDILKKALGIFSKTSG